MNPTYARRRAMSALSIAREYGSVTVCRDAAGRVHLMAGRELETVGTYTATARPEDLAEDLVFVTRGAGRSKGQ